MTLLHAVSVAITLRVMNGRPSRFEQSVQGP